MVISILGFIVGMLIGNHLDIAVPSNYITYVSVGILSCAQVIFNGIVHVIVKNFDTKAFILEFFVTMTIGVTVSYVGALLNVPLFTGLIFIFCQNLYKKVNSLLDYYFYGENTK